LEAQKNGPVKRDLLLLSDDFAIPCKRDTIKLIYLPATVKTAGGKKNLQFFGIVDIQNTQWPKLRSFSEQCGEMKVTEACEISTFWRADLCEQARER